ncbi:peptidoglycan DD-metalloendopeptidase family protein [Streptomyces spiralis]|uniref:peptidoglycan DD-metalloendopeptidase family protein n=1 Tax=Streptomyces spiralis TaxID=66376 RepID=UPI0033D81F20
MAYQQGGYFGQGYHVGCHAPGSMNQQYALDFTLNQGDAVLAPDGADRVVYAGPATDGWSTCGNTDVVGHGGGWWSVVCRLSHVDVTTGARIGNNTVIGKVGGTGGFEPHLHFSLMHNAQIDMAHGRVYGGQSAKPHHMSHLGDGGGYYENFTHGMRMSY